MDINMERIQDYLPHRHPFVLIDKILEVKDDYIRCQKNITYTEPFFAAHFPGDPVYPGVFQIEALAQSTALLAGLKWGQRKGYLSKLDKVRFLKKVVPGDVLILEVFLLRRRGGFVFCKIKASVVEESCLEGEVAIFLV